mmetsp:Transcript_51257/g.81471  ORF Transcript_51257/g.81471 Transcript_51257/m.81471 type:complete len:905 (+) Transcript_51257:76-2790(+)
MRFAQLLLVCVVADCNCRRHAGAHRCCMNGSAISKKSGASSHLGRHAPSGSALATLLLTTFGVRSASQTLLRARLHAKVFMVENNGKRDLEDSSSGERMVQELSEFVQEISESNDASGTSSFEVAKSLGDQGASSGVDESGDRDSQLRETSIQNNALMLTEERLPWIWRFSVLVFLFGWIRRSSHGDISVAQPIAKIEVDQKSLQDTRLPTKIDRLLFGWIRNVSRGETSAAQPLGQSDTDDQESLLTTSRQIDQGQTSLGEEEEEQDASLLAKIDRFLLGWFRKSSSAENSMAQPTDESDAGVQERLPVESRQVDEGPYHRFVEDEEASLLAKIDRQFFGWLLAVPTAFKGSQMSQTPGRVLVEFSFIRPTRQSMYTKEMPVSLEFSTFDPTHKSSFGAVRLRCPIDATLAVSGPALVVTSVLKNGSASIAGIRENDIIRAASVPHEITSPWYFGFTRPRGERGFMFFEGKSPSDFHAVLQDNIRVGGDEIEVVLVVERPIDWEPLPVTSRSNDVPEPQKHPSLDKQLRWPWTSEPSSELTWQGEQDKTYRFINIEEGSQHNVRTPYRYRGMSIPGQSHGTYRLDVSVPTKNGSKSKVLEFKSSNPNRSSTFGAVALHLPFDINITQSGSALIVSDPPQPGSNATQTGIRSKDIIRAASLPEINGAYLGIPSLWRKIRSAPASEQGLVFFDSLSKKDYDAVLKYNRRAYGENAEVILVIERPVDWNPLPADNLVGAIINPTSSVANLDAVLETLKGELPALLDRELHWENFQEGFMIVEETGKSIDGKEIINRLRNLCANYVTRHAVNAQPTITRGLKTRIVTGYKIKLNGFRFPFLGPFQPLSKRSVAIDAIMTFTFNSRNLVEQITLDRWLVNGQKRGLPPAGAKKFYEWAQPIFNSEPAD